MPATTAAACPKANNAGFWPALTIEPGTIRSASSPGHTRRVMVQVMMLAAGRGHWKGTILGRSAKSNEN